MKIAAYSIAGLAALGLALSACTTVYQSSPPAKSHSSSSAAPSSRSSSSTPTHAASPQAAPPAAQPASPNVTDPWAVVAAYYGDIESGDYQQAWALLDSGATTGQTYQSFVNGFACTGSQEVSEVSSSGDQVTFDLTADDTCNGQVQHFSGTDTVQDGKIVAADITQD